MSKLLTLDNAVATADGTADVDTLVAYWTPPASQVWVIRKGQKVTIVPIKAGPASMTVGSVYLSIMDSDRQVNKPQVKYDIPAIGTLANQLSRDYALTITKGFVVLGGFGCVLALRVDSSEVYDVSICTFSIDVDVQFLTTDRQAKAYAGFIVQ